MATSRTKPKDFYITGHCYMNVIENVIFILYTIIDIVYGFLRSCRKRKIEGYPSIMLWLHNMISRWTVAYKGKAPFLYGIDRSHVKFADEWK